MHLLGIDCVYFEPQHIHPNPQSKLQESTVSTVLSLILWALILACIASRCEEFCWLLWNNTQ